MRDAEYGMDHMLVRGKLKFHIMRKIRYEGIKVPKRINVSKLKDFMVFENHQKVIRELVW